MFNEQLFRQACAIQADSFTNPTEFGIECNRTVFRAATNAAQDGVTDCKPHVVNSGTGTGKTTFCISLIAACQSAIPGYSAAYIVGTIEEAQRVYNDLVRLLPDNSAALHSSAHKDELTASASSADVFAHFKEFGSTSILDLPKHPIIVCTHEMWAREGVHGADYGIRSYNGSRRTHVFIDEFPNTVSTQELCPSDLDELADELCRVADYAVVAGIVRVAATRFREQCGANGRRFDVADLLSEQDCARLGRIDLSRLKDARDCDKLSYVLSALRATGDGCSFLSRSPKRKSDDIAGHKTLVTYSDSFRAHPGLIILDATADYQTMAQEHCALRRYSSQNVDYQNLKLVHIQQPTEFREVSSRAASQEMIREYQRWIGAVVRDNTIAGETVLIVAPKKVIENLESQRVAKGRNVEFANWGAGIGSNAYRESGAVFLFSEFHMPRHAYVSRSLAIRRTSAILDDLRQANGAVLVGHFREEMEGQRLRWFKQMASRGTIRNVGKTGIAAPMRLYTTMDRTLLLERYGKVFPNVAEPDFISLEPQSGAIQGDRLAYVLTEAKKPRQPMVLTADKLGSLTGIKSKDLKRVFNGRRCKPLESLGWSFIPGAGRKSKPSLRYVPVSFEVAGFGCVNL